MKVNQVHSIEIFKLFQGTDAKQKIKSLSDKDRKIVLSVLHHIEKNQFTGKSDPKVASLLKRLSTKPVKPHKSSNAVQSFFKGALNVLNLRVSSLMINESMQAIKDKKNQVDHIHADLKTRIEHIKENDIENKVCISVIEKTIPFKLKAHQFLVKHMNLVHKKDYTKAADVLADEFQRVGKAYRKLDKNDDLHHEMKSYYECLKNLVEHPSNIDSQKYTFDLSLMIGDYRNSIKYAKQGIVDMKNIIRETVNQSNQLKAQLKKISPAQQFYARLYPPTFYTRHAPPTGPAKAHPPTFKKHVEVVSY